MSENKQDIQESIDFLGGFGANGWGFNGLFASDGNLWNVIGGNGSASGFFSAFLRLSTLWFNRQQRYAGRIAYISNSLAQSAVNKLTILTLGSGLEFVTENKTKQKKIDQFTKENNWCARDIECFKRYIVDGETFYRFYGDAVRFVDPDLVYGINRDDGQFLDYTGIVYEEGDAEEVKGFMIHNKPLASYSKDNYVSAKKVQHRKNAHWGQPRGFSWLLPILTDLYTADNLTGDLMSAAEVLAKFPLIRQWDSQQQAVETMRAQIGAQALYPAGQNGFPSIEGNPNNLEVVPRGTIHDSPATVKYAVPEGLSVQGSIEIYNKVLQKIAGQMCLPAEFFTGDPAFRNSMDASLVANSFITRQIEALQKQWGEWNLECLEKAGIDPDGVEIKAPDVTLVDKKAQVDLVVSLINLGVMSKQTAAMEFGLDYEKEIQLIKQEIKNDPISINNSDDTNNRNNRDGDGGGNGSVESGDSPPSQTSGSQE